MGETTSAARTFSVTRTQQSLPLTLGISNDTWIVLDALRKKRNLSDDTGAPLAENEAAEAIKRAKALLAQVQAQLRDRHPHLMR